MTPRVTVCCARRESTRRRMGAHPAVRVLPASIWIPLATTPRPTVSCVWQASIRSQLAPRKSQLAKNALSARPRRTLVPRRRCFAACARKALICSRRQPQHAASASVGRMVRRRAPLHQQCVSPALLAPPRTRPAQCVFLVMLASTRSRRGQLHVRLARPAHSRQIKGQPLHRSAYGAPMEHFPLPPRRRRQPHAGRHALRASMRARIRRRACYALPGNSRQVRATATDWDVSAAVLANTLHQKEPPHLPHALCVRLANMQPRLERQIARHAQSQIPQNCAMLVPEANTCPRPAQHQYRSALSALKALLSPRRLPACRAQRTSIRPLAHPPAQRAVPTWSQMKGVLPAGASQDSHSARAPVRHAQQAASRWIPMAMCATSVSEAAIRLATAPPHVLIVMRDSPLPRGARPHQHARSRRNHSVGTRSSSR